MHRAFCSFNDDEYEALEAKAKKLSSQPILSQKVKDETFICSTPFGSEWARMTTSAKRTAASQMKLLVDEGKIEKIQSTSKAHQATVYKKCGGK